MTEEKKKRKKRRLSGLQKLVLILLASFSVFTFVLATLINVETIDESYLFPSMNKKDSDTDPTPTPDSNNEAWVLSESEDMGYEYLEETLFLGDSNTARFLEYIDEYGHRYSTAANTIAVAGMGVDAIPTLECMQFSTGTYTMPRSVSILQPRRIIMTFGTNNLGFSNYNEQDLVYNYMIAINMIKEAYPYTDIIVNSIPPVTEYTKYTNVSNDQIKLFNSALKDMCRDNELYYLNSYDLLLDQNKEYGNIDYYADDGLHLSIFGVDALFKFIRTHALDTEDKRPQPLNEIPYIIGPLTNLLTVNPLNDEPFETEIPLEPAEDVEATLEPIYEIPIVEEPVEEVVTPQENIVEEPVVEEPIIEEQIIEEPIVEEVVPEEPIVEEPIVEEALPEVPVEENVEG